MKNYEYQGRYAAQYGKIRPPLNSQAVCMGTFLQFGHWDFLALLENMKSYVLIAQ